MRALILALLLSFAGGVWSVSAQAPQLINYQGRLLNGTNLANGNVGLSLRLFDESAGGTLLYEDSNTVTVTDGLYSTFIGDDSSFGTLAGALENANLFIEVAVNGAALSPRERLVSAAYAVKAQQALVFTGAVLDAQLSANIARLNGTNQAFSGPVSFSSASNTFTGTFSGNAGSLTNVQLSAIIGSQPPVIAWGDNSYGATTVPATATGVVAIAAGDKHSLALRADGTVIAWGSDSRHQTTVPASATGVVAIAAGSYHSLALRADGKVIAWGYDLYGQATVPASATGVVAIAGGGIHSLVLRADGTVIAWGNNSYGQTNVPASATGVVAIAASSNHSLALRADGTVIAWGDNSAGQTNVPASATGVVAIAAGSNHSLALRADGTVIAWGDNGFGQTTVPATAAGVVAIAGGGMHSLALRADRGPAQVALLDAATNVFTGALLGSPPYIEVAETKAQGIDAGGNNATTNNFRDLNTVLADTHGLAALSGGNITLPAGTYQCRISAPAYRVDQHQIRLRIVNDASLLYGTSEFSDDALSPGVQTRSWINGQFTLATNSTLTVQHYTALIKTVNGLGLASNSPWTDGSPVEVYTVAEFWKIK